MIPNIDTLSLTNEPTIIAFCYSKEFPSVGFQIGYSTTPINEENWDETIKVDAIFGAGYDINVPDRGYIKLSDLDLSTPYYFAAKAYDKDGNFSGISETVYVTTTDEIKSWNASSFDEMTYKSWWDLDPVLPPGSTSQVFLAYDPVKDMLMTWAGHPVSGGYPQLDELYTYNIGNLSQENTWKLEDIRFANSSDKPIGGCCSGGTYDVANKVMFKRGQHRTDSYEYYRKSNFEGWPWVYDGDQNKWFDMKSFEYMSGGNDGAGVTYDSNNQIVLILDSKHDNYHRTAIYDTYTNKVTRIPVDTWYTLGGTRSDMGLVYDSKRNRFVVVGGVLLGIEGISSRYTDVWTFDLTDKKWVEEEGVINSEILPTNGWTASDATYDSIHDKIILFLGFNVSGKQDFDGRYLLVFAYDPETKTWERMPDKPGHFVGGRPMDLNVIFSEKHNAVLSLESARPSYSGQGLYSVTMAFRYSTDIPSQTESDISENINRTGPPVIREGYVCIQNDNHTKVVWVPSDNKDIVGYNVYRSECSFEVYPINEDLNEHGELDQYTRPTVKRIIKPIEIDYVKINSDLVTANEYEDTINLVNTDMSETYPYKVYSYRIKAVNAAGIEGGWSPYWLTIANPPTGLNIDENDDNFYLSWISPHDGKEILGYRIFVTSGSDNVDEITDKLTENDIIRQNSVIIPKDLDIIGGYQRFYVVAVDNLNQEGIPSAGIWGDRILWEIYKQYFVDCEGVICDNVCVGPDLYSQKCDPATGTCVSDQLLESNSELCEYDPCEGVVCENICDGYDLWSQKCDPATGTCVADQLLESNSELCEYDPCEGVVCDNICDGFDLWSQRCDPATGICVPDQLIESNSESCEYDPCEGVVCDNICIGKDLYSQKCDPATGTCVSDQLLESNSGLCEYDPCEGVVCPNVCVGDDLWSQRCNPDTGQCILHELIEQDSITCKIPEQIPSDETTIQTYLILGGIGIIALAILMAAKKS